MGLLVEVEFEVHRGSVIEGAVEPLPDPARHPRASWMGNRMRSGNTSGLQPMAMPNCCAVSALTPRMRRYAWSGVIFMRFGILGSVVVDRESATVRNGEAKEWGIAILRAGW